MEKVVVDDDWYSFDSNTLLKQILSRLDLIERSINTLSHRVEQLHSTKDTKDAKDDLRSKDIKQISISLQELHVIKEREINALLREHIPFPFLPKHDPLPSSPQNRLFRRNFNIKL
jgi:hypothetical protein